MQGISRSFWIAATLACGFAPGVGHAVVAVQNYEFEVSGSYFNVSDPIYFGTIDIIGPPTDTVLSADIFLPDLSLEFKNILSQGLNGGQYDLNLEDTTNSYELELVIDTPSDLFSGVDGATVDTASSLVTLPDNTVVGGSFAGTLDIPTPPALPIFSSALGLLAWFRRRRFV